MSSGAGASTSSPAPAAPYPSRIGLSNVLGTIEKVTVTLGGLTHNYPFGLNAVLVSPAGKQVLLMSHAGGAGALSGVNLSFDDGASALLPPASPNSQIVSGTYKPTGNTPAYAPSINSIPPPIPNDVILTGTIGTALSALIGDRPVGNWYLFVFDDAALDSGSLASWTINLWTTPTVVATTPSGTATNRFATMENSPLTINLTLDSSSTPLNNLTVSAVCASKTLVSDTNIVAGGTGAARTLQITPNLNQSGTNIITITAKDGDLGSTNIDVTLEVKFVNQPPTISLATNKVTTVAGVLTTNVTVTLADVEVTQSISSAANLTLSAFSSNPSAVAGTNVFFAGTGLTRTMTIAPNGAGTGAATLTIQVVDNLEPTRLLTNSTTIDVTVNPVPQVVFANTARITIPDTSFATPYPSSLVVSNVFVNGQTALIGKLTVVLADVTHGKPADLGVLLVGPQGQNVVLMRNAGGTFSIDHTRITFDQDSTNTIPDSSQITNLTYDPHDYLGPVISFDDGTPANPAPNPPYGSSLDVFKGTDPNGPWNLFALDEAPGASGQINGGWLLNIYPGPTISPIVTQTISEDTSLTVSFTVGDYIGSVTNVAATSLDQNLVANSAISISGSGLTRTLSLRPVTNAFGTNFIQVVAKDNSGFTATNKFELRVLPVNDPPFVSFIPRQLTRAGVPVGPVSFSIGDVDLPPQTLSVAAASDTQGVIPDSNIVLTRNGTDMTVTLFPTTTVAGTARITIAVTDNGSPALTGTATFELTVQDPGVPLFGNRSPILISDNAVPTPPPSTASPYPSPITVGGLAGKVADITVTLLGVTHPTPDDIGVMLVGPGTNPGKVVVMRNAGAGSELNNAVLIFQDNTSALPATGPIASGSYRPTDLGAGAFPTAGSSTATTFATAFPQNDPNGTWLLYVIDDMTNGTHGAQFAGGWQLGIHTTPKITPIPTQITPEDTPLRVPVTIGDNQPGANITFDFSSVNPALVTNFTFSGTGATRTLTITPGTHIFGTNNVTVTVHDGVFSDTATFQLRVTFVDYAPVISTIANKNTSASVPITIPFTVSDVENQAITVTATSSDQNLIPDGSITTSPAGSSTTASRFLTIVPDGIKTGTATITVSATDATGKSSTTFDLTVNTNLSFANSRQIIINDIAPADPYPSIINVSGVEGIVGRATVTLVGFSHPFVSDVDVLLVSPDNRKVFLMGDVATNTAATNLRLTFSTNSTATIPQNAALTNGTYLPAHYQPNESLPNPAPTGPYGSDLNSLVGATPNGDWKLFVRDDTFPDGGSISGGWILLLETGPVISAIGPETTRENTSLVIPFTVLDSDTPATNLMVTAVVTGTQNPANLVTNLVLSSPTNGANRTLTIIPTANLPGRNLINGQLIGTNLITMTVKDPQGNASTNSFPLTVTFVDQPPTVSTATNKLSIGENNSITISFTIGDVDDPANKIATNIVVTSSNPTLVPNTNTNIVVNTSALPIVNVTVNPATNQFGSTVLAFSVSDDLSTVTTNVTLNIAFFDYPPTISAIPNQSITAGDTTTNITFIVADVEDDPKGLTVTAHSSDQSLVPDSLISLGGGDANRTIQLTSLSQPNTVTLPKSTTISVIVTDLANKSATNTFLLTVTTSSRRTFANPALITIRDNNTAQPYPSSIVVSGLASVASRVVVSVDGLTHTSPSDVNLLLVGPGGQKVELLSRVGDKVPINNVRLVFDASAPLLAQGTGIVSGTNAPSAYGNPVFPGPAPAGPYSTNLSAFSGTNPNGTWSLYVLDDQNGDSGQISFGWSVTIIPAPTIIVDTPAPGQPLTLAEDNPGSVSFTIGDPDVGTPLANLGLSFSTDNSALFPPGSVSFDTNAIPRIVATVTNAPNQFGTNKLILTVSRSDGASASAEVQVRVQSVNDQPVISRLVSRSATEGMPISFPVQVTDVDTVVTNLELTVSSGNAAVIPNTNLLVVFGTVVFTNRVPNMPANQFDLTLLPIAAGTATITVTATDHGLPLYPNGASNVFSSFQLTVTPVNHQPVLSAIPAQAIPANSTTTNIEFTVTDLDSGQKITLGAVSSDQSLVKDGNIVFVESPSSFTSAGTAVTRHVRVTSEAGVQGTATITLVATDDGSPSQKGSTQFNLSVRPSRERTFASSSLITIRDATTALPYPSVINVGTLVGSVAKAKVTLNGFKHGFPSDVEMLLVSPGGQKSVLMGKAGDGTGVTNLSLTFDDLASTQIPQNTGLSSGSFRPGNFANFTFAGPAPAKPYGSTMAALNGGLAGGDWKLFIADDTATDEGEISFGWFLALTTQPAIVGLVNVTNTENSPTDVPFTILEESFASTTNFTFGFTSTNTALVGPNDATFRGSGTNWTLTVTPRRFASGQSEIGVIMTNADLQVVSNKFTLTITPVDFPPFIDPIPDVTILAGTESDPISINYGDDDTAQKDLIVSLQSSNTNLIPNSNIAFLSSSTIQITPAGALTGSSTITVTVQDKTPLTTSTKFTVNVVQNPNPPFVNPAAITISDNSKASPYPSTISVAGVQGTIVKATVTLVGLSHTYPDDIEMILVGPKGQAAVLMANAGGGNPGITSGIRVTFDDLAVARLPDNSAFTNGTYKPSQYGTLAPFPAPAPGAPYASTLSTFTNTDPNGTWSLYVLDDSPPDFGAISGGWLLNIVSSVTNQAPIITGLPTTNLTVTANGTLRADFTVSDDQTRATNIIVGATTSNSNVGTVAVSGTDENRTVTFTASSVAGTTTITVTATDAQQATTTKTFQITVVPPLCPTLSPIGDQSADEDSPPVQVSFGIINASTNASIIGRSDKPSLVSSVVVSGTGNTRTAVVTLVPDANGSSTITLVAIDGSCTNLTSFSLTVSPVDDPPTLDPIGDQSTDQNVPLTLTFGVFDKDTAFTNLVFTGSSSNTNLVSGVSISAVTSSNAVATVNLRTNQSGTATITISVRDSNPAVTRSFFLTVISPTPPRLGATRSGNNLTISWDPSVTGFMLETSPSLTNPAWTAVVVVNNSVTIPIGTANQFFRLRK